MYRWLLRLYPASFRNEYGREMAAVFARERRDTRTAPGMAALWRAPPPAAPQAPSTFMTSSSLTTSAMSKRSRSVQFCIHLPIATVSVLSARTKP